MRLADRGPPEITWELVKLRPDVLAEIEDCERSLGSRPAKEFCLAHDEVFVRQVAEVAVPAILNDADEIVHRSAIEHRGRLKNAFP